MQILIFHQWITVFSFGTTLGQIERFLVTTGYIGVDLFFFVSAYSLSQHPVTNYKEFLVNRSVKLIPLFLIAYIAGHFLWFIPALMIVYLLLPLIIKPQTQLKPHSFLIVIIAWLIVTAALLKFIDKDQSTGIFLFRIPIIILGVFAGKFNKQFPSKVKLLFGILLSAGGIALTYKFGYLNKWAAPFKDIFYLSTIPLSLGLILLIDCLAELKEIGWAKWLGGISLEMYFTQVVLGAQIVRICLNIASNKLAANLLSFFMVITISALIAGMYNKLLALRGR
ncbi:MAG: acyltransferase family protein [Bacillota bacterium]|nr:acyltransferase family protein [Bacillota bacterium]